MRKISRKTSNLMLLVGTLFVVVAAVSLTLTRKSGTLHSAEKNFAVQDTAAIEKIFLADGYEAQSLLERTENGWMLNGQYEVVPQNINDLLGCIHNISVKDIVAKSARDNINKRMAAGATKVEIYYRDHRIKIGRLKLFAYTHKKVYYIGQATMDNMGNYAIMEGAEFPCVVYLPGFRGFIDPKYSPLENSWRSHAIVRLRMSKIREINSIDFTDQTASFRILRSGNRTFDVVQSTSNQRLSPYDTLRLLDFLSDFRDLNYESAVNKLTKEEKDSIFVRKFKEVSLTDMEGNTTVITMFYLENEYNMEEYEYDVDFMEAYSKDRFYAVINGNTEEVYLCQYFVFDRIVQPISFFFPDSEILPVPK
ncbi:MAG: hypothetical protein LBQ64_06335 [Bacteroidales bacterium]|jgi:hypothetical protein|nr:hypothetical protein [Bacteroidales bacterium]